MKHTWLMVIFGLICSTSVANAAAMNVDLNISDVTVQGLQGDANAVSLWVEDERKSLILGKTVKGADVLTNQDLSIAVKATLSTALRTAGFRIAPTRTDTSTDMLVRIQSLSYAGSEYNFVATKVLLSSKLVATVSHRGKMIVERTLNTTADHTVPFRPIKRKVAELVNETLTDTVRAILEDAAITAALKGTP